MSFRQAVETPLPFHIRQEEKRNRELLHQKGEEEKRKKCRRQGERKDMEMRREDERNERECGMKEKTGAEGGEKRRVRK